MHYWLLCGDFSRSFLGLWRLRVQQSHDPFGAKFNFIPRSTWRVQYILLRDRNYFLILASAAENTRVH